NYQQQPKTSSSSISSIELENNNKTNNEDIVKTNVLRQVEYYSPGQERPQVIFMNLETIQSLPKTEEIIQQPPKSPN
ncbi:9550_t:CDS:1, partial [Dentiscutata heterogama]